MPAPRGPRGEKVTVVVWNDPSAPHTQHVEVYASAGIRPGSHQSAKDRTAELMSQGMVLIGCETLTVK